MKEVTCSFASIPGIQQRGLLLLLFFLLSACAETPEVSFADETRRRRRQRRQRRRRGGGGDEKCEARSEWEDPPRASDSRFPFERVPRRLACTGLSVVLILEAVDEIA